MEFIKLENRQESLDYLLLNFKILSQVKDGQKLRVRNLNGLDILDIDNRLIYKYLRGFYGDNRDSTLKVIKELVDLTYKITDEILKEEYDNKNHKTSKSPFDTEDDNAVLFRKLVTEMENSLNGLNNLKETYADDISIISMLDLIIGKINSRINKINSLFKIVGFVTNIASSEQKNEKK
jgi:hypothetical protein